MALSGVGQGLAYNVSTTAAMSSVPDEDAGVASGLLTALRNVGVAAGVAVATLATAAPAGSSGAAADADFTTGLSSAAWAMVGVVAARHAGRAARPRRGRGSARRRRRADRALALGHVERARVPAPPWAPRSSDRRSSSSGTPASAKWSTPPMTSAVHSEARQNAVREPVDRPGIGERVGPGDGDALAADGVDRRVLEQRQREHELDEAPLVATSSPR